MNIIFVTCGFRIEHESDIRSSENKAWTKIQACTRFDLYDTGAALYQLSWQANWKLEIMLVRNKTLISGLIFTIA